jgi:hypothetical protein
VAAFAGLRSIRYTMPFVNTLVELRTTARRRLSGDT